MASDQGVERPALPTQGRFGGLDPRHLIPEGRFTRVAVPEFGGERDVFVLCANGHPPVASLPLGPDPDKAFCEVCAAIRKGQERIDAFLERAAARGYERLS